MSFSALENSLTNFVKRFSRLEPGRYILTNLQMMQRFSAIKQIITVKLG